METPISFWQLINANNIEIPAIQRDYVQGYESEKISLIRNRFLQALFDTIYTNNKTLELDFIYGYTIQDKVGVNTFVPLDGQQRLTTLYLLHWFVAHKEDSAEINVLNKFNYTTRHSSEMFCQKLITNKLVSFQDNIASTIRNQKWFFESWNNDPTINSMLTTLNEIEEKYKPNSNTWQILTSSENKIVFYSLPMEKFGLSDELYIKMNSRGKALTEFEYFKSVFPNMLSTDFKDEFIKKIDGEWSDGFWNCFKNDNTTEDLAKLVDDGALRFFNFIINILQPDKWYNTETIIHIEEKAKGCFKDNPQHIQFLFESLDWITAKSTNSKVYFDKILYYSKTDNEDERIRLFFNSSETDLIKNCLSNFSTNKGANQFVIGEQLMLFATLIYEIEQTNFFEVRLRILRNLIEHSSDYLRKENFASLIIAVEQIIVEGKLDYKYDFNKSQLKEEQKKLDYYSSNSVEVASKNILENHSLLKGCLYMFDFDLLLTKRKNSFYELFSNDKLLDISKAMLSLGDWQQHNNWNWRIGSAKKETWMDMFEPSEKRKGIENTKSILLNLLDNYQLDTDSLSKIKKNKLQEWESESLYPWQYYLLKYDIIMSYCEQDSLGYYYFPNKEKQSYDLVKMRKTTTGGYHWNIFNLTIWNNFQSTLKLGDYGDKLLVRNKKLKKSIYLHSIPSGFSISPESEIDQPLCDMIVNYFSCQNDIVVIQQNNRGIDIENRMERGFEIISKIIDF